MTFDEAQNLNRRQVKTLAEMHKTGIGLPSVLLLAGLSHTYDVLSAPNAISRLVANAAMNMGAMTDEECAESTLAMLDELGPTGGAVERRALAERVARVSHSWPQHLNRAQQALCRELGRVNGDLGRVDFARVEHDSDEARAGYYNNRLRDPAFDEVELLVHHIIGAVDKGNIRNRPDLRRVCREQIAALNLDQDQDSNFNPSNVADALVRKGIVCRTEDRRYAMPIPSMVEWAKDQIRESGRPGPTE